MRRRIAIWVHGGVGGGLFSQGQPAIQQLIERLAKHYTIDVFSALPPNDDFVAQGFAVYTVRSGFASRKYVWLSLIAVFLRRHFVNRYDLIYAFWGYPAGVVATLLGRLLRVPSVVHLQGGDAVAIKHLRYGVFFHPLRGKVVRAVYNHCTCLIALSQYQARCLKENGVSKTPSIIPFGPDSTIFAFRRERFQDKVTKFLHVGNLTPVKGQEVLLRVFAKIVKHRPAHLMIVGGDYHKNSLAEYCESLGIRELVQFAGPQAHPAMPSYYYNADILLHTSVYEGQGIVVAEASSCGTIVAGTAVGMLADMGGACSLLVDQGQEDLLSEKILDFIEAGNYYTLQENAQRWTRERDLNYTERSITETINNLLYVAPRRYKTSVVETQG